MEFSAHTKCATKKFRVNFIHKLIHSARKQLLWKCYSNMPVPWRSQTCSTISVKSIRRLMVSLAPVSVIRPNARRTWSVGLRKLFPKFCPLFYSFIPKNFTYYSQDSHLLFSMKNQTVRPNSPSHLASAIEIALVKTIAGFSSPERRVSFYFTLPS